MESEKLDLKDKRKSRKYRFRHIIGILLMLPLIYVNILFLLVLVEVYLKLNFIGKGSSNLRVFINDPGLIIGFAIVGLFLIYVAPVLNKKMDS